MIRFGFLSLQRKRLASNYLNTPLFLKKHPNNHHPVKTAVIRKPLRTPPSVTFPSGKESACNMGDLGSKCVSIKSVMLSNRLILCVRVCI